MTVHGKLAAILDRIAAGTSSRRTRRADTERLAVHGGTAAELNARVEASLPRLEEVARRLEA